MATPTRPAAFFASRPLFELDPTSGRFDLVARPDLLDLGDLVRATPGERIPAPSGTSGSSAAALPRVSPGDLITADLVNRLIARLEALEARLAALENRPPTTPTRPTFTPTLTFTFPTRPTAQPTFTLPPTLTFTFPTGPTLTAQPTFTFPTRPTFTFPTLPTGPSFTLPPTLVFQPGGGGAVQPGGLVPIFDPASGNTFFAIMGGASPAGGGGPAGPAPERAVTEVTNIGAARSERLAAAGIGNLRALADASPAAVARALDLSEDQAANFIAEARNLLGSE